MGVFWLALLIAALVYNTEQQFIEIKDENAYDYFHSLYACHSESASCDVSPCDVIEECLTGHDLSEAYCVNNDCGRCYAEVWSNATMLACSIGNANGCMHLEQACDFDPCNLRIGCPAYPQATCVTSSCGECRANWFVGSSPVDCFEVPEPSITTEVPPPEQSTTESYPPEKTTEGILECESELSTCAYDPCYYEIITEGGCPAYPTASCTSSFCGGCFANWDLDGLPVNCTDYLETYQACDVDFVQFGYSCYRFSVSHYNSRDLALHFCNDRVSHKTHLVSVNYRIEMDFINETLSKTPPYSGYGIWTSGVRLVDTEENNGWVWLTDEQNNITTDMAFNAWQPGFPDYPLDNDYAILEVHHDRPGIRPADKDLPYGYICQYELDVPTLD